MPRKKRADAPSGNIRTETEITLRQNAAARAAMQKKGYVKVTLPKITFDEPKKKRGGRRR